MDDMSVGLKDIKYLRTGITYECWVDEDGEFHEQWDQPLSDAQTCGIKKPAKFGRSSHIITHIDYENKIVTMEPIEEE